MSNSVRNVRVGVSINNKQAGRNLRELEGEARQLRRELKGLSPDTQEFVNKAKKLQGVEKGMRKIRTEIRGTSAAWEKQASTMDRMGRLMKGGLFAGGFAAIFTTLKSGFTQITNVRKEFEKYEAVLTNTFQDQKKAEESMRMLKDLAAETPYSVQQLTDSYVKLVNRGFIPSREEMVKMGDLAASLGKDYDQLVEAILDAQTGEFERLKEFGIRAQKEGDKVKMTFKGITEEVEYSDEAIKDYILSLGDAVGVSGSMDAISQTLEGSLSNLGDVWDSIFNNAGQHSIFKDTVNLLIEASEAINDWVETPLSEEMEQERIELQKLNIKLLDNNTKQDERKRILIQLKDEYPDYFGHLDDEEAKVEDITTAIGELNDKMLDRIILQKQEEKLSEAIQDEKAQLEDLGESMGKMMDLTIKVSEETGKQLKEGLSPLEQAESLFQSLDKGIGDVFGSVGALGRAIENVKGEQKVLNAFKNIRTEAEATKQAIRNALGLTTESTAEEESEEIKPKGGKSDAVVAAEEKITKFLKTEREKRHINSLEKNEREIARTLLHYEKMIELARQNNLDTSELEKERDLQLQQLRDKHHQEQLKKEKKQNEKLEKEKKKTEAVKLKNAEKTAEAEIGLESAKSNARAAGLDFMVGLAKEGSDLQKALFVAQKGNAISDVFMNLGKENAAHAATAATMGPAGPAYLATQMAASKIRAAVNSGLILAQSFTGLIEINKSTKKNAEEKNFAVGGFTGEGTYTDSTGRRVAGVVHDNEYVVATEELLQPDISHMVSQIEMARKERLAGFANGGPTSQQITNNQTINVAAIEALAEILLEIKEQGIPAFIPDSTVRDISKKQEKHALIKQRNTIS